MIQKYMRVELGTGYCGENEVRYYLLKDQEQTELTETDYEIYEEYGIGYNVWSNTHMALNRTVDCSDWDGDFERDDE